MKTCNYCNVKKALDQFHNSAAEEDGRQRTCKRCQQIMQKDKRSRIKAGAHVPRKKREHPPGKKICGHCEEVLPATEEFFFKLPHGYLGLSSRCKACVYTRTKERRREDWTKRLIEYTRPRHSKHTDEPYDLTPEMIMQMYEQQNGKCAWFGVQMTTDVASHDPRLVTLDRLDCSRGYTSDNVALVCKAANHARGDVPLHDFNDFVQEIKRN